MRSTCDTETRPRRSAPRDEAQAYYHEQVAASCLFDNPHLRPDKADLADEAARAVYAAATRARSHLTVVGDPEVVRAYGFTDLADELEA